MDKNLIVQIPERYRKSLERRWNIDNFKSEYWNSNYINRQPCVLCGVHYTGSCNNCPFERFKAEGYFGIIGCIKWLRLIKALTYHTTIDICEDRVEIPDKSKIPTRQLKRLVDTASKYIEWV